MRPDGLNGSGSAYDRMRFATRIPLRGRTVKPTHFAAVVAQSQRGLNGQ
jgi:hypothetical protein